MFNFPFYIVGFVNWSLSGSAYYSVYNDDEVTDDTEEEQQETLDIISSYWLFEVITFFVARKHRVRAIAYAQKYLGMKTAKEAAAAE